MFYAIDKRNNEIILAYNIRENNYKDTYNNKLKFKCADCNDDSVVYVNSLNKIAHFRHSNVKNSCFVSKQFIEYNKHFYNNWFKLFKYEYRKPYWFNIKLEEISNNNTTILIKYSFQKPETIKAIEKYTKNKIIWILSLKKRKYNKIYHYNGNIYIDFIGKKNDIPLYNSDKSIIYLDTGTDILIKVLLNNYNFNGEEIELINIYDFCIYNDDLLIAYPYRKKDIYLHKILNEKNNYINDIIYEKYLIDNIIIKYYESYNYHIIDNNPDIILKYDENNTNLYLNIILHLYYEINSKSNIRKYKRISKYFITPTEKINGTRFIYFCIS